jgi:ABC-type transporter Mla subunit MlaD
MSAGDLAVVIAVLLCALGFTALVVVLMRVLAALAELRREISELRAETRPLLAELRASVDDARDDLDRFDRVLGSAEAISANVEGVSRVARIAFSTPLIKTVALASGTSRTASRLRKSKELRKKGA